MKKIFLFVLANTVSSQVEANRYIEYEPNDSYYGGNSSRSSSAGEWFGIILLLVILIYAFKYGDDAAGMFMTHSVLAAAVLGGGIAAYNGYLFGFILVGAAILVILWLSKK